MTKNIFYYKSDLSRISEFNKISPETFKLFASFDYSALSEGELNKKTKRLIAIAIAHITGCAYCIETHVKAAKKEDVDKEEMVEAIMVAVALKAGSAAAHSVNALNAFDDIDDDHLYKEEYFKRLPEIKDLDPKSFKSFVKFDSESLKENVLDVKTKELIAVASAHVTGCPYCINDHVKTAKKIGVKKEELTEAIMVAVALKAGSAMAHGIIALKSYNDA